MSAKRKKRVLAIDDEPSMTEWLKILLEHAGYEVRTALIGTRGEEIFRTWHPWMSVTDYRNEQVQRALLWRYLTGDDHYDVDHYLTRLEGHAAVAAS